MFLLFLVVVIIGFAFYVNEQKNKKENENKSEEFIKEVRANDNLDKVEKRTHIEDMYRFNGFGIIKSDNKSLTVSKKYFSIGAAMMWFGFFGAGLFVYLAYYIFFKKPEIKTVFFK